MEKDKYKLLEKKVQNLESQLTPLLYHPPPNPETLPYDYQSVTDDIHNNFAFVENLLKAEVAQSPTEDHSHKHHLRRIARRVHKLKSSLRAWTKDIEPAGSSMRSSLTVEDDEHQGGEDSLAAGFTVYNNPEFADENDDGKNRYNDEITVQEIEDCSSDKGEKREEQVEEEDEEDDGGDDHNDRSNNKCYYKVIVGVMTVGVGMIYMMMGFPEFGDHHPHVYILTPT